MELPKGVVEPAELFGQYQKNYIQTLNSRRDENATNAQNERGRIIAQQYRWTRERHVGDPDHRRLLVLMFFFLPCSECQQSWNAFFSDQAISACGWHHRTAANLISDTARNCRSRIDLKPRCLKAACSSRSRPLYRPATSP
jgi:hypothetical protein